MPYADSITGGSMSELEDSQKALLNILQDLREEKASAEDGRRALQNILEDLNAEGAALRDIQAGMLNILEDLREEKSITDKTIAKDEALLASIGDGVIAIDSEGKITLINKVAESMLGWKSSEVYGKQLDDTIPIFHEKETLIPREKRPMFMALSASTITSSTSTTGPQYYYVRKDGGKFPIAIAVTPVILDGKIIGAIEIFRDITLEIRIDRTKSEFMSLASHQLRTPLTTVRWIFGKLMRSFSERATEAEKELMAQGLSASARMSETIGTMLEISRIESGDVQIVPTTVDLCAFFQKIVRLHHDDCAAKNQSLDVDCPDGLTVQTDVKFLQEIIENLLNNAIKYTPAGGSITLKGVRKGKRMMIHVKDTGYGIPANQQEKIFTKFFRGENIVRKDTTGTGLGLYLVSLITNLLGGEISFISEEGKGTILSLTLNITAHE